MSENTYTVKIGNATYSFGGPCPTIKSMFFPIEEKQEEKQKKEKQQGDEDDSAQSS